MSYKELVGAVFGNSSLSKGQEQKQQKPQQEEEHGHHHAEGSAFAYLEQAE